MVLINKQPKPKDKFVFAMLAESGKKNRKCEKEQENSWKEL